jgi:hypothetical protein
MRDGYLSLLFFFESVFKKVTIYKKMYYTINRYTKGWFLKYRLLKINVYN